MALYSSGEIFKFIIDREKINVKLWMPHIKFVKIMAWMPTNTRMYFAFLSLIFNYYWASGNVMYALEACLDTAGLIHCKPLLGKVMEWYNIYT